MVVVPRTVAAGVDKIGKGRRSAALIQGVTHAYGAILVILAEVVTG
jgi:hypothetical protein